MRKDYLIGKNLNSMKEVSIFVRKIFNEYSNILPKKKSSKILLKPNFNSDMIALTGNTTDLRVLVAVIKELQKRGYVNIAVGDGTSSGFVNAGIDVLKRLGIRELGRTLNFKVIDLNKSPSKIVDIGSEQVKVAKVCFDCDFFINLPKIKTHAEAFFSCCMKNLIGCVSGSSEKQKIHKDLFKNIILLNKIIKPDLNIVDGLVSMEGTGPSMGNPVNTRLILAGKSSDLLDYIISKMFGLTVPYVKDFGFKINRLMDFKRPKPSFLFKLINGKLRPLFVRLRYNHFLYKVFSNDFVGLIIKKIGARQDIFNKQEPDLVLSSKINSKKTILICPLSYYYNGISECKLKCLYCFFTDKKVVLSGNPGYLSYQINNYGVKK